VKGEDFLFEIVKKIIENVLMTLYQTFGFSLILAILFMFLYMYAKENNWKTLVKNWVENFKSNSKFRYVFFFALYTSMLLFKTLLNRTIWINPITNVFGIWGLYNEKGEFTSESIENLMLFVPFTIFLLIGFKDKILGQTVKFIKVIWQSVKIVFLFSLSIEFLQLFWRLGTFQISDLFYNTLGGGLGGIVFWFGYKMLRRKKLKECRKQKGVV